MFIETDDCLAKKEKKKKRNMRLHRSFYTTLRSREETSSTISVRLRVRKYEAVTSNTTHSSILPLLSARDKSMLHEFTADELARSFHEITRYKRDPCRFAAICKPSTAHCFPPPLSTPLCPSLQRGETQLLSFHLTK